MVHDSYSKRKLKNAMSSQLIVESELLQELALLNPKIKQREIRRDRYRKNH